MLFSLVGHLKESKDSWRPQDGFCTNATRGSMHSGPLEPPKCTSVESRGMSPIQSLCGSAFTIFLLVFSMLRGFQQTTFFVGHRSCTHLTDFLGQRPLFCFRHRIDIDTMIQSHSKCRVQDPGKKNHDILVRRSCFRCMSPPRSQLQGIPQVSLIPTKYQHVGELPVEFPASAGFSSCQRCGKRKYFQWSRPTT